VSKSGFCAYSVRLRLNGGKRKKKGLFGKSPWNLFLIPRSVWKVSVFGRCVVIISFLEFISFLCIYKVFHLKKIAILVCFNFTFLNIISQKG